MHSIPDHITDLSGTVQATTPCYCRGEGCNNYSEWDGEDMRTGPAVLQRNLECWELYWRLTDGQRWSELRVKTCGYAEDLCSYTVDPQGIHTASGCVDEKYVMALPYGNYNETSVSAITDTTRINKNKAGYTAIQSRTAGQEQ